MKILSPAGNLNSLKMAVLNGADEVYLGINSFNARNNIDGFNLDNLLPAIDYAHLHNVKVNLAINILFKNNELQSALDTIITAYNMGVDSFIIQDLGLAYLVHTHYPEIEIHASTQMGLHNLEGIKWVEQFGFKRIVLARETPLDEIKRISNNSSVELEYFAHGALCVSFSGNCYLSSYLHNASGNRGKCKQLCRLPYTLKFKDQKIKSGYLLSAKDFNMADKLSSLQSAGINVLKIEGRARRPYFVGITTQEYKNALNNKPVNTDNLKLGFNREYTAGYLDGNHNIISPYHNHIGLKIGKVERINNGKKFNEVYFSSNRNISAKSTLKFYLNNIEQNTITAYDLKKIAENKYMTTTTQKIPIGSDVHLIADFQLEEDMLNTTLKKVLPIKIIAKENMPIKAILSINNNHIEISGAVCNTALNQPLSHNDLSICFGKSETFEPALDILTLDNVFISKKDLNEFRRNVYEKALETITNSHRRNLKNITIDTHYNIIKFDNFQVVDNINQKLTADNIIYSPNEYSLDGVLKVINKCKSLNKTAYLDTPNFALKEDIELLKNIIEKTHIAIIANNYYALTFDTQIVIGAGLNTYNNITAQVYNLPILTAESNIANICKQPYMTLRHCPMKSHLNANCNNCPYKVGYTYQLESGKSFKLTRKKLSTCTFYLTD